MRDACSAVREAWPPPIFPFAVKLSAEQAAVEAHERCGINGVVPGKRAARRPGIHNHKLASLKRRRSCTHRKTDEWDYGPRLKAATDGGACGYRLLITPDEQALHASHVQIARRVNLSQVVRLASSGKSPG